MKCLIQAGVKAAQIGVITPYNGQVQLLKKLFFDSDSVLFESDDEEDLKIGALQDRGLDNREEWIKRLEGVEIRSVDGFQGGEKECIIISLVRSNDRREVSSSNKYLGISLSNRDVV